MATFENPDLSDDQVEPGDVDDAEGPHAAEGPTVDDGFAPSPVPAGVIERAREVTMGALDPAVAVDRLRDYYDLEGGYAGRTFLDARGAQPNQFAAADLFAVSLLQVTIHPRAARVFLDDGPAHDQLVRSLADVPTEVDLARARPETYLAMAELYRRVKETLGKDPWVTASKVCARKRPKLFPVRDRRVRILLDVYRLGDYSIDWQVISGLMATPEVGDALSAVAADAAEVTGRRMVSLDEYPLRQLDVLLWMHARAHGIGGPRR